MGRYAESTSVSSSASQQEIERTVSRYGARSFMYGRDDDRGLAVVAFLVNERQVRFLLPMPDPKSREFTYTPERGIRRSDAQAEAMYEQAIKQRWRALALVIKAKLEAVETGIVSFEEEFGMHMVLPSGRTVAEEVLPAIETAYATGQMQPLLPDYSNGPKEITA